MKKTVIIVIVLVLLVGIFYALQSRTNNTPTARTLKVGIAPYQDMAMLMNADRPNLEKKYNIHPDLITLAWEDLTPSVSSAVDSLDVAFASLTQFVTNERNINRNTKDPLVFIYPAYVFLGGSFVSFNPNVEQITKADLNNTDKIKKFLGHTFAAESKSQYEEMLFMLAKRAGVDFKAVHIVNIGSADGLLAAINGSVDVTSAGLTQRNEAMQKGGRVVLDSIDLGSVDIAGFVAKQSTLDKKQSEIEDFIRLWYGSIDYVISDPDTHSAEPIAYLDRQSSTHYTVTSFKDALSHEVFPKSISEVNSIILNNGANFDFNAIRNSLTDFLLQNKVITEAPQNIKILNITP